jgi:hypothetical protein
MATLVSLQRNWGELRAHEQNQDAAVPHPGMSYRHFATCPFPRRNFARQNDRTAGVARVDDLTVEMRIVPGTAPAASPRTVGEALAGIEGR